VKDFERNYLMPEVTHLQDKDVLVETSKYPDYAYWPFEKFNPPQSCVIDVFEQDANIGIAAATSAGKTVCAEMYMAHEIRTRGGKAMYLGTHKALVQEKLNDWTDFDHHFSDLNISICSGDYQLTDARKKELAKADIICMTSEMLASRCRNFKSEKNNFLLDLGTLVVDESHLLTVPGRGDHLEVALMKITEINPNIRIVLLSATMPNVVEICEWLSFNLNGKDTYYLNSQYRPCPLDLHYPMYYDQNRRYDANEASKVDSALDIVKEYPDDKFLIFAHTKRTGESMKSALKKRKIQAEFHNANCSKAKRTQIETDFCNPKKELRCVIATSTLAWGMNLPARRVIVLGVHRGLTEVDTYDIAQMVGRAGRPKFDKKGDAYILLPQTDVRSQKNRITNPVPITSQLLEHHKILAFHLVSEIHQRTVKTLEDIHKWYSRSLGSYQSHNLDYKVDDTLEALMKCGAVVKSDEGIYDVTAVGRIASMFYYSPFDVADLKRNFKGLFEKDKQDDDLWLSMALGNTDSNRTNIVTRADKAAMEAYYRKIEGMSRTRPKPFMEAAIKGGFAYHCLLTGNMPPALYSFAYGLKADFDRLVQVLNVIDSMSGQWEMKEWFESLSKRVMYGVKPELMSLIEIAEVGKVRAEMLFEKNIKSAQDILDDPQLARAVLNVKPNIFDKIVESAQALAWKSML
jgi:replicative superfamily II helicase